LGWVAFLQERSQQVDGYGENRRRIFLRGYLDKTLEVTELQGRGLFADDLRRIRQLLRGLKLTVRMNHLGPSLALRLRLFGHGPLHLLRKIDMLQLDKHDFNSPGFGLGVQDLLYPAADRL